MEPNGHMNSRPGNKIEPTGQLLRPAEVVRRTGLSRSQVYALISGGRFPPFLKLGKRASAMPEVWLNAFVRFCADEARCSASGPLGSGDAERPTAEFSGSKRETTNE